MCNGKVARRAAIYHHELCQPILRGMKAQMHLDGTFRHGEAGANIVMHDGDDEVHACYVSMSGIESTGNVRMEDGTIRNCLMTTKVLFVEHTTLTQPLGGSSSSSTLEWRNFSWRGNKIYDVIHSPLR